MFIRLTPAFSVAAQIDAADCAAASAQGFTAIVCNRPDGESPGQPEAAEIAAAAQVAGLDFVHIPVDSSGIDDAQIAAMAAVLGQGPVLAYCRSGTRSTNLWALAEASRGGDADAIAAAAATGGYDVSGMLPYLRSLAKQG